MAITLEELEIRFSAQFGGLQGQLDQVKNQMTGFSKSTTTASRSLAGLGRVVKTVLFAYAGRALINVGKDALSMANDVVESESLFAVSMKGMADEAREWSDDLSDSLGLNAYNLRRNVGTFNTMFKSMGLGEQKAYDMATAMTQLAEDMASFYNVDPEEMFTKLRAGITGETEPLKRLGIMVDENTIKQYAMAAGISNTGKEMTQTEKLMARYAAIIGQTADAQGDLARTIDSPANQIRILNNQLDMLKISLGQAFQPIQSAVIPLLSSLANALTPVVQAVGYFIRTMSGFSAATGISANISSKSAETQDKLSTSLDKTAKSVKAAGGAAKQAAKDSKVGLKAFDEINKLAEEATKTGSGGGGGFDEMPEINETEQYADALDVISQKVKDLAQAMKDFWDKISKSLLGKTIGAAWEALKNLWDNVIKPMGEWMIANPDIVADTLMGVGAAVATWQIGTQSGWLGGIASGLGKIGAAIKAHPGLFTLSVIAVGIAAVVGAVNAENERQIKEENIKRFGTLTATLADLRNVASTIKTPFTNAMNNLKSDFDALVKAGERLQALADLNAQTIYGYKLIPETFTQEKATELIASVQKEVDDNKSLLESAQIKATMGLEALFSGTTVDGSGILKLNTENWEAVKKEAAELGREYLDAVTDAAFDGVISDEEWRKVANLQKKLLEMTTVATNPDALIFKAQIRKLGLEFDGANLTAESVENFQKALDERWVELEKIIDGTGKQSIDYALAVAIQADPDISNEQLNKIRIAAETALSEQKLTAQFEVEEVRISSAFGEVQKAFSDVLDDAEPAVQAMGKDYISKAIAYMMNMGWSAEDINTDRGRNQLGRVATVMMASGVKSAQIPEGATKKAMQEWLDAFQPNYAAWKAMEAEYKRLGLEVPTALSDGISDYEAMTAIAGDITHLAEYINQQATLDTTKWSEEGKKAVAAIGKALRDGEIDVATATSQLKNAMEREIRKADLVANVKFVVQGLVENIKSSPVVQQVSNAVSTVANSLTTTFKKALGIKSPSTVFAEFGKNIDIGLADGILKNINHVLPAVTSLSDATIDAMGGINGDLLTPMGISADGHVTVDEGPGIAGAIEAGIERGIERVMNLLNFNFSVDGETFGRVSARTINEAQRNAGRFLLEM